MYHVPVTCLPYTAEKRDWGLSGRRKVLETDQRLAFMTVYIDLFFSPENVQKQQKDPNLCV